MPLVRPLFPSFRRWAVWLGCSPRLSPPQFDQLSELMAPSDRWLNRSAATTAFRPFSLCDSPRPVSQPACFFACWPAARQSTSSSLPFTFHHIILFLILVLLRPSPVNHVPLIYSVIVAGVVRQGTAPLKTARNSPTPAEKYPLGCRTLTKLPPPPPPNTTTKQNGEHTAGADAR